MKTSDPNVKIEVKDAFSNRSDYKVIIQQRNIKALQEALKMLEDIYGFPVTKAVGRNIDEEEKTFVE
jgi:hypothetical protein